MIADKSFTRNMGTALKQRTSRVDNLELYKNRSLDYFGTDKEHG